MDHGSSQEPTTMVSQGKKQAGKKEVQWSFGMLPLLAVAGLALAVGIQVFTKSMDSTKRTSRQIPTLAPTPMKHFDVNARFVETGMAEEPTHINEATLSTALFQTAIERGETFYDARSGSPLTKWEDIAALLSTCSTGSSNASECVLELLHHTPSSAGPSSVIPGSVDPSPVPFIWPPVGIGHTVQLDHIKSPSGKPILLETLRESPKIFLIRNFMSDKETDDLIAYSQDPKNPYSLRQSTTGHTAWNEGGMKNTNSRRTSLNAFDISSPTSRRVKERAFHVAGLPVYDERMADGIQVLRYEEKQAYIAHNDAFSIRTSKDHNWDPRVGGTNRFATVLLYLSDVEEGGQTCFPKVARDLPDDANSTTLSDRSYSETIEQTIEQTLGTDSWEGKMSTTCYNSFSMAPKKGDALLFYSQLPDGSLDPLSLHGACPVLSGIKWAANVWIWNGCRYKVCQNLPPS